jgi:hypothetical protein
MCSKFYDSHQLQEDDILRLPAQRLCAGGISPVLIG